MAAMKGKWAQGIQPRNFAWVIKDRLANNAASRRNNFGDVPSSNSLPTPNCTSPIRHARPVTAVNRSARSIAISSSFSCRSIVAPAITSPGKR